MSPIIPSGQVTWGLQLPVQSQSPSFVQPWESTAGTAELVSIAQAADRAGAFYIGVCDHVGVPRPADERMSAMWYDTIATLGWLGALTKQVRLLSHVYVLPYRHPLAAAKAFLTLDNLSDGRAILGAGAGHLESEFEFLGVDFESRGQQLEESVGVIRAAFAEQYPTVGGPGAQAGIGMSPRPSARTLLGGASLPIWIGGSSKVAIRRAALLGDGWLPQGPPKMGLSNAISFIRSEREAAGLPVAFDLGLNFGSVFLGPADFDLELFARGPAVQGGAEEVAERINKFAAKGINQIQVRFLGKDAQQVCDQIEQFGAEVGPLLSCD
jgi:alkanesulfonate monooxygenase SsuD/methylene tetrahydromethanopterin reductase-like flavin-dependent oxidoreductase (luciferase family)